MLFLFFLFLSDLVRGFTIFRIWKMSIEGVYGLVLSLNLFKWLVLKISSQEGLKFGFFEGIISKIPNRGGPRLGNGNVNRAITLWVMLIYLFKDGRRLEAINRLFQLVRLNYLALFCKVLFKSRLEFFSKKSNKVGFFWSIISIKPDKDRLKIM